MFLLGFALLCLSSSAFSLQNGFSTTPVPILKQINRHNDDGSYSYGFEAADGTFKIETKRPSGEVFGKYGYVGDDGQVRIVVYGASKRGFEPKGSHINVAPPTISNSVDEVNPDYDDGQYREDPSIYEKETAEPAREIPPGRVLKASYRTQQYQNYPSSVAHHQIPQTYGSFQALAGFPAYQSRFQSLPVVPHPGAFNGHPATNIDINTGSYTVSYTS